MAESISTSHKLPVVSVITVVYNGVNTLERTIKSILCQTYPFVEFIIVDGASNDGTLGLIENYASGISKWISEPDSGLYDAMNKGLAMASGDFVWFINSGDEIANPNVLESIFSGYAGADIFYGETIVVDNEGKVLGDRRLKPPANLTWEHFKKGMLVSHQSVIIRKSICDSYDTRYRFSADYKWVLSALMKSSENINTQLVLSRFLEGGLTKKNIVPGLKERFKIMTEAFGFFNTLICHIPIGIRFVLYYVKNRRF